MTPGKKDGRGRPTQFDTDKAKQICQTLEDGNFLKDAAALVGVHIDTVYGWLERGRKGEEPFATFAKDVAVSRAKFTADTLKSIHGGHSASRGRMWMLEKLRPEFSDRVQVHLMDAMNAFLERAKRVFPLEVYERIVAVAAGELGDEGTPETPQEAWDRISEESSHLEAGESEPPGFGADAESSALASDTARPDRDDS